MALLISKNIKVLGDIDVSTLYVRLSVHYGPGGSTLITTPSLFASKAAYESNPIHNALTVKGISNQSFKYDREIDGTDILTFVHNKFKDILSTDTSILDVETLITIPKFAEDSSISIIDI